GAAAPSPPGGRYDGAAGGAVALRRSIFPRTFTPRICSNPGGGGGVSEVVVTDGVAEPVGRGCAPAEGRSGGGACRRSGAGAGVGGAAATGAAVSTGGVGLGSTSDSCAGSRGGAASTGAGVAGSDSGSGSNAGGGTSLIAGGSSGASKSSDGGMSPPGISGSWI